MLGHRQVGDNPGGEAAGRGAAGRRGWQKSLGITRFASAQDDPMQKDAL